MCPSILLGDTLLPYRSDNATYMRFLMEDESVLTLVYDSSSEDFWERSIEGISEYDLLDGIMYAG